MQSPQCLETKGRLWGLLGAYCAEKHPKSRLFQMGNVKDKLGILNIADRYGLGDLVEEL